MKVGNGRQALRYVLSPLFITVLEMRGRGFGVVVYFVQKWNVNSAFSLSLWRGRETDGSESDEAARRIGWK